MLNWGSTEAERAKPLVGDSIVPGAKSNTRAITIDAPVDKVWPWLAQTGQDRGGFYSYDLLENVVGCAMTTEDYLRPSKQEWKLGDKLWMYPPDKAGGAGHATLREMTPGRGLGFATRMTGTTLNQPENGSWSFALEPINVNQTRLLIRGRGTPERSLGWLAFDRSAFEPMHFAMEKRMMLGIKSLAEGKARDRMVNHVQVVLWTITVLLGIASALTVIRGKNWESALLCYLAAGALFQVLTLGQPPVWLGGLLLLGLFGAYLRVLTAARPASGVR